jgi:hypothetical protein
VVEPSGSDVKGGAYECVGNGSGGGPCPTKN